MVLNIDIKSKNTRNDSNNKYLNYKYINNINTYTSFIIMQHCNKGSSEAVLELSIQDEII